MSSPNIGYDHEEGLRRAALDRDAARALARAAPVDRERLEGLIRHMAGRLMDAERQGTGVLEAYSAAEARLLVAGLEALAEREDEAEALTRDAVRMSFTLGEPPASLELGRDWPEAMQHQAKAYRVAERIKVVNFKGTEHSALASFLVCAAGAAIEHPEVAQIIGRRMR